MGTSVSIPTLVEVVSEPTSQIPSPLFLINYLVLIVLINQLDRYTPLNYYVMAE